MTNTTTTSKKIVKRDYFNALAQHLADTGFATENITNEMFTDFIAHEIELLNRKSATNGDKKPTATQIANEKLMDAILDFMQPNTLYTSSELTMKVPEIAEGGWQNQKTTALMKKLAERGQVEKTVDKKKVFYTLA